LVVALCCAIALEQRGRRLWWCSHSAIAERLPGASIDRLDAAIATAVAHNLVQAAGNPPISLWLTIDGHAVVEQAAGT
jgi:hypothetical protein